MRHFQRSKRLFTVRAVNEAGEPLAGASLTLVLGRRRGTTERAELVESETPGTYTAWVDLPQIGTIHYQVEDATGHVLGKDFIVVEESLPESAS